MSNDVYNLSYHCCCSSCRLAVQVQDVVYFLLCFKNIMFLLLQYWFPFSNFFWSAVFSLLNFVHCLSALSLWNVIRVLSSASRTFQQQLDRKYWDGFSVSWVDDVGKHLVWVYFWSRMMEKTFISMYLTINYHFFCSTFFRSVFRWRQCRSMRFTYMQNAVSLASDTSRSDCA